MGKEGRNLVYEGAVMKNVILGALAGLLVLVAVAACASRQAKPSAATQRAPANAAGLQTTPSPTPAQSTTPPTTPQAAPSPSPSSSASQPPQVIARFNSSGTENTPPFTVPDSWHLSWEYWGCSSGTGNFIVDENNTDGSSDLNGIAVNELGSGAGPVATYAYGDAGTHYFAVTSECSWSLAVVVGGQ
jgi:hypothetical protein